MPTVKDIIKRMVKQTFPGVTTEEYGFAQYEVPAGETWTLTPEDEEDFNIDDIHVSENGWCWINGVDDGDYYGCEITKSIKVSTCIKNVVHHW